MLMSSNQDRADVDADDDHDDVDVDDDEVVVSVSHSGAFVRANYGPLTS